MRGQSQHAFWVTLGADALPGVLGGRQIKKGGVLAPECEGLAHSPLTSGTH